MYRQYTQCYNHTAGDKPFNADDLAAFVLGASTPGLVVSLISFLLGAYAIGFTAIGIQFTLTIIAVANEWLFHRLVCLGGDHCAIGTVESPPAISSLLGAFDNDQYFDIRLMPHRHADEYRDANSGFFAPPPPGQEIGTPPWTTNSPPMPGPSLDGKTEAFPRNDIFLDGLQGSTLIQPTISDLPYTPEDVKDTPLNDPTAAAKVTRCTLHCEAEGNFWAAMKDYAVLLGLLVGVSTAVGAGAGAAAGCAIGGLFGPIGCLIGAILGAILGGLLGAAGGAYLGANAAFNSDPGDVNDANVGDLPLTPLQNGDHVAVYGTLVYDGFHTGWHEIHPLKKVVKATDPKFATALPYLEWDPDAGLAPTPYGLSFVDMQLGLESPAFAASAGYLLSQWCGLLREAEDPTTKHAQNQPPNRWTVHPDVDGCQPDNGGGVPVPR